MVFGNRELKPGENLLFRELNGNLLLICKNPRSDHRRSFSSFPSSALAVPSVAAFSSLLRAILSSSSLTHISLAGQGIALFQVVISRLNTWDGF